MPVLERKRNTYLNWKYAWWILLIPIGFYFVSRQSSILPVQHVLYIVFTVLLGIVGVFGLTSKYGAMKVYGGLYITVSLLFAYMGLVFLW
ncbi:hypothetical protein [Salimicrobium halophilum]|uniref:Uncharacterized protein n=1 Tax=Salimicrobium halophilum TaxID=86666 RepID=A0A1G8VLH5_9BACI|nr:hypothetical protein [Salimicrobium halophilum]SDJ66862.1 hypothetical protein SAMN04490247_2785 [Salimicrobium halophilum]